MVYCSVACCSNGNHNRKDLSYFTFPSDKRLKTWIKFCRRADKKFAQEAAKAKTGKANNLRICSAHFSPEAYRKTLNGRRETHDTVLPTLFRPKHDCTPRGARYDKSSKRRRLESYDEGNACLANQLPLAATDSEDLTHVDYSYVDYCNVEHDHHGTVYHRKTSKLQNDCLKFLNPRRLNQWVARLTLAHLILRNLRMR